MTTEVRWGTEGAPATLRAHVPCGRPRTPAILLVPGFAARRDAYDAVGRTLASHGFLVVVPHMGASGLGALVHTASIDEEAEVVARILAWLPTHAGSVLGVRVGVDDLALAGHSRGGKVCWRLLSRDPGAARAVFLLDPVDGGGRFATLASDTSSRHSFGGSVFVLGAGVEGPCAPPGKGHAAFAASAGDGAWHVVLDDVGHADFLDEPSARLGALLCRGGANRAEARRRVAGWMVAFFREALDGDGGSLADHLRAEEVEGAAPRLLSPLR